MHPLTLIDNTPTTGQAPVLSRKACEVVGSFIREKWKFDANTPGEPPTILAEFALLLSGPDSDPTVTTCKGPAFEDELVAGLDYRLFGRWKPYTNPRTKITEEQFVFDSFVVAEPASRDAVISYLSAAGEGLGLGRARASRLWQEFGADAVRVMREQPSTGVARLRSWGLGITDEQGEKIAANLLSKQAIEGCSLDLQTLLSKRGFPRLIDRYAIAKWGNKAAERIRRNPYVLLQFKGCGFKRCDSLYRDLKLPLDWIVRQGVAAWDAIARDSTGNIWFPLAVAESGVNKAVGREKAKPERALHCAKLLGGLRELQTSTAKGPLTPGGNIRWVAERRNADHEQQIAEAVVSSRRELLAWPDVSRVGDISEHQRENLRRAIAGPIGILGGGPGTGKTFTVAALAKLLVSCGLDGQILIGAPTGKAAVRVTENLANYGLSLRAKTWHSHLAAVQSESKRDHGLGIKPTFRAKILISDESSMIDADLFSAIMRHRAAGSHLLLVGDVHQLPPVGPGAPLRDLIFAGLPYGELTEIKRNSGGIVEACAAIRQGRKFTLGDNLTLADCSSPDQQIAGMLHAIHYAASAKGLDPIWDVQPLAAVNEDSPLARKTLNEILQNELNPSPGVEGSPFRLRDKVVCLKNGKYKNATGKEVAEEGFQDEQSGEIYVANGELAEVVDVDRTSFVARLKSPDREVRVFRGKDQPKEKDKGDGEGGESGTGEGSAAKWDLGYCLSVHKSQGSEWPLVLVMLDSYPGAKRVESREWLYTGVSRAKSHCRLIGDLQTAYSMCERVSLRDRKTFLAERIGYLTAEETLAGW